MCWTAWATLRKQSRHQPRSRALEEGQFPFQELGPIRSRWAGWNEPAGSSKIQSISVRAGWNEPAESVKRGQWTSPRNGLGSNGGSVPVQGEAKFITQEEETENRPDLNIAQIPASVPIALTKRLILSQVNGIYDLMGLAGPVSVKAKILTRELWAREPRLGWKDPIPDQLRDEWVEFFNAASNGQPPEERLEGIAAMVLHWCGPFGPFITRGETRVRGKAYGVLFNCMTTRAVHMDASDAHSTDGFMRVLRRFTALRCCPAKLYSDGGSQLVAANKQLETISKAWNWDELEAFAAGKSISWEFAPPDAPSWNGCNEALSPQRRRSTCCGCASNDAGRSPNSLLWSG